MVRALRIDTVLSGNGVSYLDIVGGLWLRDIKAHAVSLASKWIYKALWGDEPWRVLVRNNIEKYVVKKWRQ